MIKSNDLSAYTVITTGSTLPGLSWVRALNCLQNSMIFTPLAPNAGPTGGDGFAAPPLICNLINALTTFAIFYFIYFSTLINVEAFFLLSSYPFIDKHKN